MRIRANHLPIDSEGLDSAMTKVGWTERGLAAEVRPTFDTSHALIHQLRIGAVRSTRRERVERIAEALGVPITAITRHGADQPQT